MEQLCINFANESLQGLFNRKVCLTSYDLTSLDTVAYEYIAYTSAREGTITKVEWRYAHASENFRLLIQSVQLALTVHLSSDFFSESSTQLSYYRQPSKQCSVQSIEFCHRHMFTNPSFVRCHPSSTDLSPLPKPAGPGGGPPSLCFRIPS